MSISSVMHKDRIFEILRHIHTKIQQFSTGLQCILESWKTSVIIVQ